MRAVAFVVVAPWVMSFLFFGWRTWATWPSKQERKRQRDVSKLYVYHFDERRRQSYSNAVDADSGAAGRKFNLFQSPAAHVLAAGGMRPLFAST